MTKTTFRLWMEIDLDHIVENYRAVLQRIPEDCQIMPVVKANAYGTNAVPIALELEKAGCGFFAVTFLEEALRLRKAGLCGDILVMAPIEREEAELAARAGVTVTLCEVEGARALSEKLSELGQSLQAHIKLDTGLSRLGLVVSGRESQAALEARELLHLPQINVKGIYTHITASDIPGGDALNRMELERFRAVSDTLRQEGYPLVRHCLSTGPLVNYPAYACDYVRLGSILYGAYGSIPGPYGDYPIKNSIYLKARVMQVKDVPQGTSVSYGPLFTTLRDTRLAVVPIGFADGLRRSLSNAGRMIVRGKWAPIIGKICCDHTMLDVTDIPEVRRGDVVTIFGRDQELEQFPGHYARLTGATAAETTAAFHGRIPRITLRGGCPVE